MKVPNLVHESHPWVLPQIAADFELLDVWSPPIRGSLAEFDDFLDIIASLDPTTSGPTVSRWLFSVRLALGSLLGWDDVDEQRPIPGCQETTLRARLTDELRAGTAGSFAINETMTRVAGGFTPLYRTEVEAAAEISNATVHGVLHVGWVETAGHYRPHLAVYVKARGTLGRRYLRLIEPFRQLIVYPALMRQLDHHWRQRPPRRINVVRDPDDSTDPAGPKSPTEGRPVG